MNPRQPRPILADSSANELALSSPDLVELLRAVLAKGQRVRFRARGFSMSPFIKDGDTVVVSPLSAGRPGFGDVVAFTHPATGKLVVHRVVGRRGPDCLAKGDSNSGTDGWVPRKCLLGRVTAAERQGRPAPLGLGPERFVLALLTRFGLFKPLIGPAWRVLRLLARGGSGI